MTSVKPIGNAVLLCVYSSLYLCGSFISFRFFCIIHFHYFIFNFGSFLQKTHKCVIYWKVQQSKCRMTFLMTEYQIGHIGNDRIPTFLMTEYQIDCISIDRRGGVYARSSPIFFQRKIIYVPRGAGADSIAKRVTCFPESW